jgi:hypothetical protein
MSVVVNPISGCRHGNQLCQYFTGRIISEKLKFKLFGITPEYSEFCLNGFDLIYDQEGYQHYEQPVQVIGLASSSNRNSPTVWTHPDFDIDELCKDNTPRKIVLDGYFQKKNFFIPHVEDIKVWYGYSKLDIPNDHVAMHIRLGDLKQSNHPDLLPLEYYIEALKHTNFSKITICTDTPSDEYIQYFVKNYNAELFLGNEKETITFLASHNNLILSVGSFSFWASLFSEGTNIINAIPRVGNNRIDPDNGVDLLIQSPRHKYITL